MTWFYYLFLIIVSVGLPVAVGDNTVRYYERSQCSDMNNVFLIPGVLSSGTNNRGCLSRFGPSTKGGARLQVFLPDTGTFSPAVDLSPGDGGCIDFGVPPVKTSEVKLIVKVKYGDSNCTWTKPVTVRVLGSRLFLIQTERPRYRPGEMLRLRILQLLASLVPPHASIDKVWLQGPPEVYGEGARVTQWLKVSTRLGIAQLQYTLDEQAPSGQWTIRVKSADGSQGSANFWVGDYELPPFQLSVIHSPTILRTSDRLIWTVCIRYPWGEAAQGLLVIRLRGAGDSGAVGGVRTVVHARTPQACHRHAVAAARVGLTGRDAPQVIVADFSFQEDGTRVWQNTSVVSIVVEKPVRLEFMASHRTTIAPALPYKLKVKAISWNEKPAGHIPVTVCRTPANELPKSGVTFNDDVQKITSSNCSELKTDSHGIARILFTLPADYNYKYHKFNVFLKNDTTVNATLQMPVASTAARAVLGAITYVTKSRTLIPVYLNLGNITASITVHFAVITQGGVIYRWGTTTQCPIFNSNGQVRRVPANSVCDYSSNETTNDREQNGNRFATNKAEADQDRSLPRIMLPIRVTHQMCPDSHMIAYFYNGEELISTIKHFEVNDCFRNQANLTWSTRQIAPKSMASVTVSTSTMSICAISALDVTARGQLRTRDLLMAELRRLVADHRNITAFDCCYRVKNTGVEAISDDEEHIYNTLHHFSRSGVRLLGGVVPPVECSHSPSMETLINTEASPPRSDFSEAWLWKLVGVNSNGTTTVSAQAPDSITRYEVSGICVARNGLSIPKPDIIQVFTEFFIHADIPRKLRRGDAAILKYRIFNYLYEDLPVEITVSKDSNIIAMSDLKVSTCIKQRASFSHRVELKAISTGPSHVKVQAVVISDRSVCNLTANVTTHPSDEIVIPLEIEPEGVAIEEYRSMLLCAQNPEVSPSEVTWKWDQRKIVPGTESLKVWAIGDAVGPLLAKSDSLVSLPRGCGEQNMARLASNVLALMQLHHASPAAAIAKDHVATGFSRQLQYTHPTGGFSAFGAKDPRPSTWLTAFTVRYLRRAHLLLAPGTAAHPAVRKAETWLLSLQMENGCFRSEGQLFHRELRGGLSDDGETASVALTAFVIISLIEGGATIPANTIPNALSCLRALPMNKQMNVYVNAVITYAYMKVKSYETEIMKKNDAMYFREKAAGLRQDEELKELIVLLKLARRSSNFVWWDTGNLATSIEATGYAMLSLSTCPGTLKHSVCAEDARGAMRWLSTHRSSSGGFQSTQDTLVAIEGLQAWSALQSEAPKLNVSGFTSSSQQTVKIMPSARYIPVSFKIKPSNELMIQVDGTGCALVQATRSFNTLDPKDSILAHSLSVQVAVHSDGPFNCNAEKICYCAAMVEVCAVWTGAFPEMALLDVRLPSGYSADTTLLYSQLQKPGTILRRIETSAGNSKMTLYLSEDGHWSSSPKKAGHYCIPVHVVGPRAHTRPAHATIINYYSPHINHTQVYTIPEECPSKISAETAPETGTDNIFNNARSIKSDGEIIIIDEFNIEDMPEGIPLEDPLLDSQKLMTAEKLHHATNTNAIVTTTTSKGALKLTTSKVSTTVKSAGKKSKHVFYDRGNENTTKSTKNKFNLFGKKILFNESHSNAVNVTTNLEPNLNKEDEIKQVTFTVKTATTLENSTNSSCPVAAVMNFTTPVNNVSMTENFKEAAENVGIKHNVKENLQNNEETNDQFNEEDFSNFHIIHSEIDLDVPYGVEGPVPALALPPEGFDTGDAPLQENNQAKSHNNFKIYPQIFYDSRAPNGFNVDRSKEIDYQPSDY